MDNTKRFSNRAENYVKFRPSYPSEAINYLYTNIGINKDSIIADIGSGTGIFTKLILTQKNKVYAVEPNKEMREAAENMLSKYKNFISVNGTAENTTLTSSSVDFVVSAQAFHWFDGLKAKKEFSRILHPNGKVILVWNRRIKEGNPLFIDYEQLLVHYGKDYKKISVENTRNTKLEEIFQNTYDTRMFPNNQCLNFDQLKGRLLSLSCAPLPGDDDYEPMIKELKDIFDKYNNNGFVSFQYQTIIYWGSIR